MAAEHLILGHIKYLVWVEPQVLQHPVADEGVVLELGDLVGPEVEADQTLEVLQRAQPGQW